ncbi:MAG: lysophospholipid acyltransferase family protein [Thermoguttaceae bacterium]|nr:lysophospholipid acyltransferase family protein [Thermoguttaceae bacterium]
MDSISDISKTTTVPEDVTLSCGAGGACEQGKHLCEPLSKAIHSAESPSSTLSIPTVLPTTESLVTSEALASPVLGKKVEEPVSPMVESISEISNEVDERPASSRHHHIRAEMVPSNPVPFWENMPDEPTLIQSICRSAIALTARFISGATPRWLNSQPDTCQRIYFANHTSNIDGPIIWATLPPQIRRMTRPVAAADYWRKSFVRRFVTQKVFNTILIDRKEVSIRQNPISIILREMGTRYSIIIFPEGRRSTIGDMLEFKSGLYYLAKKRPDLELIPVYLNNMNRVLPRGEILPVPLLSTVNFGPPIWLEAGETKQDFLRRARGEIIRMRERIDQ